MTLTPEILAELRALHADSKYTQNAWAGPNRDYINATLSHVPALLDAAEAHARLVCRGKSLIARFLSRWPDAHPKGDSPGIGWGEVEALTTDEPCHHETQLAHTRQVLQDFAAEHPERCDMIPAQAIRDLLEGPDRVTRVANAVQMIHNLVSALRALLPESTQTRAVLETSLTDEQLDELIDTLGCYAIDFVPDDAVDGYDCDGFETMARRVIDPLIAEVRRWRTVPAKLRAEIDCGGTHICDACHAMRCAADLAECIGRGEE